MPVKVVRTVGLGVMEGVGVAEYSAVAEGIGVNKECFKFSKRA